jgi:hypothetical protein
VYKRGEALQGELQGEPLLKNLPLALRRGGYKGER